MLALVADSTAYDTAGCPPGMHRTFKRYACGTGQYTYHEWSSGRTFRSKKLAWQHHNQINVKQQELPPPQEPALVVAEPFYAPALTEADLSAVAAKYGVDVETARFHHTLRGKYPEMMAHWFDLNYTGGWRRPCNDIRCCGLSHDDSDLESLVDEVEVESCGGARKVA